MFMPRHCVCHFIIRSLKDSSCCDRTYLGKFGAFLNSFQQKDKRLIRRLERIKDRIGKLEVSVLFNKTCLNIITVI